LHGHSSPRWSTNPDAICLTTTLRMLASSAIAFSSGIVFPGAVDLQWVNPRVDGFSDNLR